MKKDYFHTWCAAATARIRFGPDRKAVAAELRSHLEDHRDALMEKGIDEAEASKMALDSMGSAQEIAPQLAAIHSPFWGYFLRVCQVVLVLLLILSLKPVWNYAKDLRLADKPTLYHTFDVYDSASYGGDTGRTLHHLSRPGISFSTDGSTFTLTDAAVYTAYSEHFEKDRTHLYVLIRQDCLLPYKEHREYFQFFTITGYFCARDSLGNFYEGFMDKSSSDAPALNTTGVQSGIFSYTSECWINDFPQEAEWVEICYERDGRSYAMRVYLTGGVGE